MRIRQMKRDDLEFAVDLTSAEGWMSTMLDFEEILLHDPQGSFVGEVNGQAVGMVCTVPYDSFGFIGNLIVIPEWRGRQYGEALMVHAMQYLRGLGVKTHMLDGVEMAIPLYERLGFEKIAKSLRLEGRLVGEKMDGIRPIMHRDLKALTEFDSLCFGCSRCVFLETRLESFPELCMLAEDEGHILGYIMGSRSGHITRIGPWVVGEGNETAEKLLSSFGEAAEGGLLRIGVLETSVTARDLLRREDFREISFSWRMSTDPAQEWSCSTHLFAICSPARG
jgi:predicted N-acetyltransferase YhbS